MSTPSDINFKVHLDENKVPEKIDWSASDVGEESSCNAMLVSLWDEKENNTLRIDLWTKEMTVDDMKRFFHQSIVTMADTFERATNEADMAEEMRAFGTTFAEKMGLLESES
ncbi:MAG: gliding motility protein GldC [Flavobacteriales bacterium]|nr:gliding motility protein GldC [Flavobacteriales bacterium]